MTYIKNIREKRFMFSDGSVHPDWGIGKAEMLTSLKTGSREQYRISGPDMTFRQPSFPN